jgi:protein involved in polysaccharide export with SLBB domain
LDGEFKDIPITNISQFENIESRDLDRIFIRVHSFRNVEISGAVLRPGNYKMIEGDNIFDLIERSGGYTQNAFPQGAIYQNKDAELINKLASEKLYNTFIDALLEIIQQGSGETDITSIVTIANELKNTEPNGRVIVDLLDDTTINLVMNNDVIRIPEKNNNVFIFGEVLSEGSLIYQKDANLEFYLKEASGLKDSADSESIFILYPNGRTKQFSRKRNLFASQSQNIKIEAGSVIFVPRAFDNSLSSRLTTQAYASILGNIGVTLASISAINNN